MFSPGERVVCIDDSVNEFGDPPLITRGRLYTVSSCEKAIFSNRYGVRLHEMACPPPYNGWKAERFRRIEGKATDISVFTSMLTPEQVDA